VSAIGCDNNLDAASLRDLSQYGTTAPKHLIIWMRG
jgi:hypothetical protein